MDKRKGEGIWGYEREFNSGSYGQREVRDRKKRVMAISAHPDDVDFGCSGTIALWAREGWEAYYVILTNGDRGSDLCDQPQEKLTRIRQQEQQAAAKIIGVKEVLFLGFRDGELENTPLLRREIVQVIRQLKPRVVFSHDPANLLFENQYVSHSDHRAAAIAVFDSVYPAAGNCFYFSEHIMQGLTPHKVSELYFFGTPKPDTWIDISPTIDTKIEALLCHKSQFEEPERIVSLIRERAKNLGEQEGLEYAETFRRLEIKP